MDHVNKFFEDNPIDWPKHVVRKRLQCQDGFSMSVQASNGHYCRPREDNAEPYLEVEVGYPSEKVEEFWPYIDGDPDDPDQDYQTVYGYVPVDIVNAVIEKHGGLL
jgi:hypothetical protein